ncbi:helix-turn-helix domain-containing protein [Pseudonocardia alni]
MSTLWSVQDLADWFGVPVQTVHQWRNKDYGPRGVEVGKHVRFRPTEVERRLDSLDRRAACSSARSTPTGRTAPCTLTSQ